MSSQTFNTTNNFFQEKPLPWQDTLWMPLIRRIQSDQFPHSLLLTGSEGVGKHTFAIALANRLLCNQRTGQYICHQCKSCQLLKAGTHPDLMTVQPESSGKPIKIDQIRKVNEFVRKTAQQGGGRVVVISPSEAMNTYASNALLKSLEEPGSNTYFILVSARSGDMLSTIRSRCQIVSFTIPDKEHARTWLSDHIADALVIDQLLELASGSPIKARDMFDNDILSIRGRLVNALSDLFRGNITPVEMAKDCHKNNLINFLMWIGSWLDDAIKLKLSADESTIRNKDQIKMVGYLAKKAELSTLFVLRDKILLQRQELLEGANLNSQILMEGVYSDFLELVL